jgi:hypothetical protein
MNKIVSVAVVASALILVGGASSAGADNTRGVCNSIVAQALGPALQFVNGVGDPVQQCTEIGDALVTFVMTEGCIEAFVAGELRGIGGPANVYTQGQKAGQLKPVGEAICGSLCGCDLLPGAQMFGICPDFPCDMDG